MFSAVDANSGRSQPSTQKKQYIHQHVCDNRKSPFVAYEARYVR